MTSPANPVDVVARFSRVNLADCALVEITVSSQEEDSEGQVALDILLSEAAVPPGAPARLTFVGCLYVELSLKFGVHAAVGRQLAWSEATHPMPAEIKQALTTVQWVDIPDMAKAVCFTILSNSGDRARVVAYDFAYSIGSVSEKRA